MPRKQPRHHPFRLGKLHPRNWLQFSTRHRIPESGWSTARYYCCMNMAHFWSTLWSAWEAIHPICWNPEAVGDVLFWYLHWFPVDYCLHTVVHVVSGSLTSICSSKSTCCGARWMMKPWLLLSINLLCPPVWDTATPTWYSRDVSQWFLFCNF